MLKHCPTQLYEDEQEPINGFIVEHLVSSIYPSPLESSFKIILIEDGYGICVALEIHQFKSGLCVRKQHIQSFILL